ncbi:MAG TPA: hypothetical protein VGE29_15730 [Prosthecobacter sp.]
MMPHHPSTVETAVRGLVGAVTPLAAVIVSKLAEIEQWLRILSLSGGLVVCALTIRSFLKKKD